MHFWITYDNISVILFAFKVEEISHNQGSCTSFELKVQFSRKWKFWHVLTIMSFQTNGSLYGLYLCITHKKRYFKDNVNVTFFIREHIKKGIAFLWKIIWIVFTHKSWRLHWLVWYKTCSNHGPIPFLPLTSDAKSNSFPRTSSFRTDRLIERFKKLIYRFLTSSSNNVSTHLFSKNSVPCCINEKFK